MVISLNSFGQTRLSYGIGGILPVGISINTKLFNTRIRPEIGIGVFGAWAGSSFRVYENWSIGGAHGLQMIPSVGGWRSLIYFSNSWNRGNLELCAGAGARLDWFDRKPSPYPSIFIKFSRR